MKKYIFFISLLCLVNNVTLSAQTGYKIDKNTLIIDYSTGKTVAYEEWSKLVAMGDYELKPVSNNFSNGFYLVKVSEEVKAKRDSAAPKPKESNFFTTGTSIFNFNEKDINNNKWNLKNLKGKIVVLNFWFINCPPCRMEMPALNKVVDKYKNEDSVVFISFCLDKKEEIETFLSSNPFNYNIVDDSRMLCQRYGVTSYPTHVVLDKNGVVQYHTTGLGKGTVPWLIKTIESLKKN